MADCTPDDKGGPAQQHAYTYMNTYYTRVIIRVDIGLSGSFGL